MRYCVALCLLASLVGRGGSQPPAPFPLPKSFDPAAVEAYVADRFKEKDCVGLSIAVMRDGQVVLAKGFGTTAQTNGSPVTADTPFAIGSITKQFACAAILLLAEDGKLSIHDPVAKYYPDLTQARDVTLYDLMTHASGYPDYYPLDFLDRRMKQVIAPDELIRIYAGGKLDFPPKSKWSYSNTGYVILGRVVEKVTGQPFATFLEKRITTPLGMNHTFFEPPLTTPGLARGHTSVLLGPPTATPRESDGWIHAAGGMYSSVNDLMKWNLALVTGRVLKPESFKIMVTPRELSTGKVHDYGCGLGVSRQGGELVIGHTGAVSGFLAFNSVVPRTKSAVALLTNGEHADVGPIQREILQLLLRDEARREQNIPKINGPPTKDSAIAMFQQLQASNVDRQQLGDEYSHYLSEEVLRSAAARLKELGDPVSVEVEGTSERGGMEEARIRFTFKSGVIKASMYRSPDGKIQQFLLRKG
jgi:CubicO group peptidase (beta-lactamase class C family)